MEVPFLLSKMLDHASMHSYKKPLRGLRFRSQVEWITSRVCWIFLSKMILFWGKKIYDRVDAASDGGVEKGGLWRS